MSEDMKRLRGLKDLTADAVTEGASAVEQVHRKTAGRTFSILKSIPAIAGPSALVESVHDAILGASYDAVRGVTKAVSSGLDMALDAADKHEEAEAKKPEIPETADEEAPTP